MKNRIVPGFELAFENPGNSNGFSLWQLSNLWQRKLRERLDPHGVTHVQFLLLNCLAVLNKNQQYAITQRMLSSFSGCDKMMTSKVLRTLENRKLIQRKNHHSDTRSKSLLLTTKGMEVLQLATESFQLAETEVFECLGKKEKGFGKKLRKILQHQTTLTESD